jgi:dinuclear metal center YbgI/SA1388 family protein
MANLKDLIDYSNDLLAIRNFKDCCPNGLQVQGRPEVCTIIGGVTACQRLLDLAVKYQADAVLVHHGYFWNGEDPCIVGMKQKRLSTLLRNGISLIAYHLPMDVHPELGNNAQLANALKLNISGTVGQSGLVMIGTPSSPLSGEAFANYIACQIGRRPLYISGGGKKLIQCLAWCTGAAQSYIEVACEAGADAFLTGEISEQTVHFALENGLHFFAAGHHATERYGIQALGACLSEEFDLKFIYIDIDNPI